MGSGKGHLLQYLGGRKVHLLHDTFGIEECAGCVPWSVRYGLADCLGQHQELLRDGVERHQQLFLKYSFCYPVGSNDCVYSGIWILYHGSYQYPDNLQHYLDSYFHGGFFCAEYDPYHSDNCVDGNLDRNFYGHEHHQHDHHYRVERDLQHHQAVAGCVQVPV